MEAEMKARTLSILQQTKPSVFIGDDELKLLVIRAIQETKDAWCEVDWQRIAEFVEYNDSEYFALLERLRIAYNMEV